MNNQYPPDAQKAVLVVETPRTEENLAITEPSKTNMKTKDQYLLVTTLHKGVFAGFGKPTTNKTIRLTEARMCVYWSKDVKGIVGLAANGPTSGCKIGPAAPAMTLQDVTSVMEVSEKAMEAWNKQPWA